MLFFALFNGLQQQATIVYGEWHGEPKNKSEHQAECWLGMTLKEKN